MEQWLVGSCPLLLYIYRQLTFLSPFQSDPADSAGNNPLSISLFTTTQKLSEFAKLKEGFATNHVDDFVTHHIGLEMTRERLSRSCSDKWPACFTIIHGSQKPAMEGQNPEPNWFIAFKFDDILKKLTGQLKNDTPQLMFISEVSISEVSSPENISSIYPLLT